MIPWGIPDYTSKIGIVTVNGYKLSCKDGL